MSMSEELSVANHDAEHPKPDRHDSVLTMHLAAIREMSEPRDGISPTPVSYIFFCFVLVMWGGWYIGTYAGDWTAVGMAERTAGGPPVQAAPRDQMEAGKEVFNLCTQCHQETGLGVPGSYPPLAGSEYVLGDERRLVAILIGGLNGEFVVKGKTYSSQMPSWKAQEDEDIAAVLSYVRNSFGNKAGKISKEFVAAVRKEAESKGEWRADTLAAFAASKPAAAAPAVPAAPAAK